VDVGFGDADDIVLRNTGDSQTWRHIQQAYVTATKDKFTVDFGKWVTPIGAEVIETKDNWNYTRGLLFTFATPFYHFGGRGTFVAGEKATLSGYVVNGWNNVRENNAAKSVGFVGVFKPINKVRVTTNVLVGRENLIAFGIPSTGDGYRQLFDGVVTYSPADRVSLMANYDYTRDKAMGPGVFWQGVAAYGKVKASRKLTVSSRYEWFGDEHNAFRTGISQNLQSFTATAQIPWSELALWLEYRRDWSNVPIFNSTDGQEDSSVRNNQNTITFGLTYVISKTVK
jgi:putative OmpL-like beta-barrel porin-2